MTISTPRINFSGICRGVPCARPQAGSGSDARKQFAARRRAAALQDRASIEAGGPAAPERLGEGGLVSPERSGVGGLASPKRSGVGGFTLVEVLIAATLSTFVLAGVLSAFLFLAKTSFRSSGYSEMEAEVRRGLDTFARDTRNATDVHWNSAQSVTLTLASGPVTYAYDADASSGTFRGFYRLEGAANSTRPRTVLVHGVTSDFAFRRFKLEQPGVLDNTAGNDSETKLLQLTLRTARTNVATVGAGNSAVSARYMLRNKRVAN